MRWLLLLLVTLLMFPVTLAEVNIELSTDNSTWFPIDAGGQGIIDENNSFAIANNLQPNTEYFYRGNSTGTAYQYGSFFTGRVDEMTGIMIGLSIIALFFGIAGFLSQGWAIRVLMWGLSLVQVVTIAFVVYLGESSQNISGVLQNNFRVIFIISFLIAMITLIFFVMKIMSPEAEPKQDQFEKEMKWAEGDKW